MKSSADPGRRITTYGLLASLVLVFGVEVAAGALGNDARLLSLGAIPDDGTMGGQVWRLLTYAWLHANTLHLVSNLVLLWWVGKIVERRVGSLVTLGVYVSGALAGGLLIAWNASANPRASVSLGASAAVSALLTCALVLLHRPAAAHFGRLLWVRVVLWAVLAGALGVSLMPGISLAGHFGGLLLGAVLGFVVPVRRPGI